MKSLKFRITGTTALMLNNAQMVNPFNEYSKQLKPLTSKRTKTEDDLEEISKIKFKGSWYVSNGAYILPSQCIEKSIIDASKERKLGKKFERSFRIFEDAVLEFDDMSKSLDELYEIGTYVDVRAVGIKNVKITTTRTIVPKWSAEFECWFDETQLDEKDIKDIVEIAGMRYGVGTYRRLYGKFKPEIVKKKK